MCLNFAVPDEIKANGAPSRHYTSHCILHRKLLVCFVF